MQEHFYESGSCVQKKLCQLRGSPQRFQSKFGPIQGRDKPPSRRSAVGGNSKEGNLLESHFPIVSGELPRIRELIASVNTTALVGTLQDRYRWTRVSKGKPACVSIRWTSDDP